MAIPKIDINNFNPIIDDAEKYLREWGLYIVIGLIVLIGFLIYRGVT